MQTHEFPCPLGPVQSQTYCTTCIAPSLHIPRCLPMWNNLGRHKHASSLNITKAERLLGVETCWHVLSSRMSIMMRIIAACSKPWAPMKMMDDWLSNGHAWTLQFSRGVQSLEGVADLRWLALQSIIFKKCTCTLHDLACVPLWAFFLSPKEVASPTKQHPE